MTLYDVRDLFADISTIHGVSVNHYSGKANEDKFVVWAEDGETNNSLHANGKKQRQEIEGTINYFTKEEYDSMFDIIQNLLNSSRIAWKLDGVRLAKGTDYIHYQWTWKIQMALE